MELSIIVPAYKQEKTISANLKQISLVANSLYPNNYEVICVVDGILDNTYKVASKLKDKRIKVVGYKKNRGKGCAVRYGLGLAKGKLMATVDAGNDLSYEGLKIMLEHFRWYDADIVIGSKRHPVSKVKYPWQRRILSFGYQIFVKVLFGLNVKDTQVGMKIFKSEVVKKLLPRLLVKQYAFDIEVLSVANYLGFTRIYEAPVEISLDFNKSSGIISKGFIKTIFNMLKDTTAVFYRLRIKKYYDESNMINWHTDVYPDVV